MYVCRPFCVFVGECAFDYVNCGHVSFRMCMGVNVCFIVCVIVCACVIACVSLCVFVCMCVRVCKKVCRKIKFFM